MPDHQADRLLRSIEQNQGKLSQVLLKEMPVLGRAGIWETMTDVVAQAFEQDTTSEGNEQDSSHIPTE